MEWQHTSFPSKKFTRHPSGDKVMCTVMLNRKIVVRLDLGHPDKLSPQTFILQRRLSWQHDNDQVIFYTSLKTMHPKTLCRIVRIWHLLNFICSGCRWKVDFMDISLRTTPSSLPLNKCRTLPLVQILDSAASSALIIVSLQNVDDHSFRKLPVLCSNKQCSNSMLYYHLQKLLW